jgi:hypothetical protein
MLWPVQFAFPGTPWNVGRHGLLENGAIDVGPTHAARPVEISRSVGHQAREWIRSVAEAEAMEYRQGPRRRQHEHRATPTGATGFDEAARGRESSAVPRNRPTFWSQCGGAGNRTRAGRLPAPPRASRWVCGNVPGIFPMVAMAVLHGVPRRAVSFDLPKHTNLGGVGKGFPIPDSTRHSVYTK